MSTTEPRTKTKWQTFEYVEIPRVKISDAPYNASVREITAYARGLLKKKLEDDGCVEALVWNKHTGHLVSGHQRLNILDQLEGTSDYIIGVTVVNLPLEREKALSIFLNNQWSQGHYKKEGLFELLNEGIKLDDIGMTRNDLELEFQDLPDILKKDTSGADASLFAGEAAASQEATDQINKMKEARKGFKDRANAGGGEQDADYYLLVAFPNVAAKEAFLRRINEPVNRQYMNIEELKPHLTAGLV